VEYKQLRGRHLKEFREKSIILKDKRFKVEIFKIIKVKDGRKRTIQINADEFRAGQEYEIYIKHKTTKQRRLLAIGKLQDIPLLSKQREKFGAPLGGRTFDPTLKYPKRARGKWIPVSRIVRDIQKELEERGMDLKTEVRASIIPMKRYFHSEWLVYSDRILNGNTLVRTMFVHCALRFVYPNMDWIGKQSIRFDFKDEGKRRTKIKNLHKLRDMIEKRIDRDLKLLHPNAEDVSVIEVNGFIPLIKANE
jgi:hypothetical protein